MATARSRPGRYGQRDATMILLAYRHGLRVSELVGLRWDMLDLAQGHLHVQRLKNGRPSVHTVRGTELRALRRLQREQRPPSPLPVHHRAAHADDRRRGFQCCVGRVSSSFSRYHSVSSVTLLSCLGLSYSVFQYVDCVAKMGSTFRTQ